jgi:hypothetical protein
MLPTVSYGMKPLQGYKRDYFAQPLEKRKMTLLRCWTWQDFLCGVVPRHHKYMGGVPGGVVRSVGNDATAALPEKVGRIAILPPCNRTNRSHEGCGEEWESGDVVWLGLCLDD